MGNKENRANTIATGGNIIALLALFISVLALVSSIRSNMIADDALLEASEPDFVIKKEKNRVILSNEGKGVGLVSKIAYKQKNSNELKCLKDVNDIVELKDTYRVYKFDKGEAIKASGYQKIIICKNKCNHSLLNYDYYVSFRKKHSDKIYYTSNTPLEIINKMRELSCAK